MEAAALIQKTRSKVQLNFQKRHPQKHSYWGCLGGSKGSSDPSRKGNWQAGGSKTATGNKSKTQVAFHLLDASLSVPYFDYPLFTYLLHR